MSKNLFNILRIVFILTCSINIAVAADEPPPPQVAVSPSMIETTLGKKPSNEVIYVYNLGDEPMTVNTTVTHWDTDKNNEVRIIPPTEQSLDQWIIINPIKFTIPAGERQTVRLSIRPQSIPTTGEHRGMVFFKNKLPKNVSNQGAHALFRIGVGIYGLAGNIVRQGVLESLSLTQTSSPTLAFTIKSTGNANIRLSGQYTVWRKTDFVANSTPTFNLNNKADSLPLEVIDAALLTTTPVLAGTTRTLLMPITLPKQSGQYVVFVNGSLGKTIIKQALDINIP